MIRKDSRRQHRNTVILIVSLAAVFLVLCLFQTRFTQDSGLTAVIQMNQKKVHTMDLDRDDEFTVRTDDGHYNIVVVKNHSVMVRESDCPNQVCVKTGQIRFSGEVIACLPHSLIIYIE